MLGQYVMTRESRRLTMIVCHLGCAVEGKLAVGEPIGNGSPY
jgi:hypothetical protein